jgi:hypothetical protein
MWPIVVCCFTLKRDALLCVASLRNVTQCCVLLHVETWRVVVYCFTLKCDALLCVASRWNVTRCCVLLHFEMWRVVVCCFTLKCDALLCIASLWNVTRCCVLLHVEMWRVFVCYYSSQNTGEYICRIHHENHVTKQRHSLSTTCCNVMVETPLFRVVQKNADRIESSDEQRMFLEFYYISS